jgi:hypothetical protein
LIATLRQDGVDVGGSFDMLEVMYSGGYVKGIVAAASNDGTFGTLRARFEPSDLGTLIVFDTKITSPDGASFAGTFVLGDVWRGNATFTRVG